MLAVELFSVAARATRGRGEDDDDEHFDRFLSASKARADPCRRCGRNRECNLATVLDLSVDARCRRGDGDAWRAVGSFSEVASISIGFFVRKVNSFLLCFYSSSARFFLSLSISFLAQKEQESVLNARRGGGYQCDTEVFLNL